MTIEEARLLRYGDVVMIQSSHSRNPPKFYRCTFIELVFGDFPLVEVRAPGWCTNILHRLEHVHLLPSTRLMIGAARNE
jgi:hypothetical protein